MNHLAAFILRLAATSASAVAPWGPGSKSFAAAEMFLGAANEYDAPASPPAWLLWNAPGGKA